MVIDHIIIFIIVFERNTCYWRFRPKKNKNERIQIQLSFISKSCIVWTEMENIFFAYK
jgi:predicted RNA-binding protein with PUA domain